MELKSIRYSTAIFFGLITLILYVISGIFQITIIKKTLLASADYATMAQSMTFSNTVLKTPIIVAIVVYILVLLSIAIYNALAKVYPISWEIKK